MDEIEWWEFEDIDALAVQAAGDIAFIIESAIEAHKHARIALPGRPTLAPLHAALAKVKGIDWSQVTIIPTDDRLLALDDPDGAHAQLKKAFAGTGAEVVSLIDESALGDYREAGRLADARLSLIRWPLDLACVALAESGEVAGILPGPDFDSAVSGPRERRALGLLPGEYADPPGERVTLSAAAITSARAVMLIAHGAASRRLLERAIDDGPLSAQPVGRLLAGLETPADIFWSAD